MVLTANTYARYLDNPSMSRRDFRVFGDVASRASVCVASGPRSLDGFRDRCERIIEHVESLS